MTVCRLTSQTDWAMHYQM